MEPKKSIFASKTFWFNLAGTVAVMSGALPPNKYTLAAATIANVGLRLITSQPVAILPADSTTPEK